MKLLYRIMVMILALGAVCVAAPKDARSDQFLAARDLAIVHCAADANATLLDNYGQDGMEHIAQESFAICMAEIDQLNAAKTVEEVLNLVDHTQAKMAGLLKVERPNNGFSQDTKWDTNGSDAWWCRDVSTGRTIAGIADAAECCGGRAAGFNVYDTAGKEVASYDTIDHAFTAVQNAHPECQVSDGGRKSEKAGVVDVQVGVSIRP